MNRFILKHSAVVTFVILAILAWFVYRQFIVVKSPLFPFIAVAGSVWILGAFLFIYFWPAITSNAFKRAIQHGFGGDPVPVNTIYAVPDTASSSAPGSSLLATGASDLLYLGGWLDLSKEPLVLHVPDFSGRYYGLQFIDPTDGTNFAYIGKRATGTRAGDFLITGPGWQGVVPQGIKLVSAPHNSVIILGRALVNNVDDAAAVYALTRQVQLSPLSSL